MKDVNIAENIKYIGVDDKELDLFENQYILKNGMAYNSYLILDDKIAIMDTVDKRKTDEWLSNLEKELDGRKPDYLVISHLEPDHSGSIGKLFNKYPNIKIISNEKDDVVNFLCKDRSHLYSCVYHGYENFKKKEIILYKMYII